MRVAAVILVLSAGVASADGPRWTAGPERAYNCTHYLPALGDRANEVKPGEAMTLTMPVDKEMRFRLAANPAIRGGKVRFEATGLPPGAKLDGAAFSWKVAGKEGQRFPIGLVAIGDDGAKTTWPMTVVIADAKLFTAWRAGMGSVWPDCSVIVSETFTVADLDGDGKDDVIYRHVFMPDASTTHVMLQRGTRFIEALSCEKCSPTPELAVDGTHLLVDDSECCCIQSFAVSKLVGDGYVLVEHWDVPTSCHADPVDGPTKVSLVFDARHRVTGVEQSNARVVKRWAWRAGKLEPVDQGTP